MKIRNILLLLITSVLLTGCIDIFHALSLNKGQVDMTLRYTMQKAIFEMGASFSGEEVDYGEFMEEGNDMFDEFEELDGTVTPIETEYEIGAELRIRGSVREILDSLNDSAEYIPVRRENRYEIVIPGMGEPGEEVDEFGAAFLSGAQYRLLLDMNGDLRKFHYTRVREGGKDVTDSLSINRYGSSLLIEIPLILMMYQEDDLVIELHDSDPGQL